MDLLMVWMEHFQIIHNIIKIITWTEFLNLCVGYNARIKHLQIHEIFLTLNKI